MKRFRELKINEMFIILIVSRMTEHFNLANYI